jgi:hypothetical protein
MRADTLRGSAPTNREDNEAKTERPDAGKMPAVQNGRTAGRPEAGAR